MNPFSMKGHKKTDENSRLLQTRSILSSILPHSLLLNLFILSSYCYYAPKFALSFFINTFFLFLLLFRILIIVCTVSVIPQFMKINRQACVKILGHLRIFINLGTPRPLEWIFNKKY